MNKGQFEATQTMIRLIFVIGAGISIAVLLSMLIRFRADIQSISSDRKIIDLEESILGDPCLTVKKGVFSEEKLDTAKSNGICLNTDTIYEFEIKSKNQKIDEEWRFSNTKKPIESYLEEVIPALLLRSNGTMEPAILDVVVKK